MKKGELIYSGKAKSLFATDDPTKVIVEYRDDTSAFNAKKLAKLTKKGMVNNHFSAYIMEVLHHAGIPTHHEKILSDNESLAKRLDMIPVECVVRNVAAGSLCKRLGVEEGIALNPPLFEFFYKDDELGDPLINANHILSFGWATKTEIQKMEEISFNVNAVLSKMFHDAGMILVDYKLEFGRFDGNVMLGDEFTPDGCRIWDSDTREKLDKDRFRLDLGDVVESYQIVADKLNIPMPS